MVFLKNENIYIVGILKTLDKGFQFPPPVPLDITVLDVLENESDLDPKFGYLTEHKNKTYKNYKIIKN